MFYFSSTRWELSFDTLNYFFWPLHWDFEVKKHKFCEIGLFWADLAPFLLSGSHYGAGLRCALRYRRTQKVCFLLYFASIFFKIFFKIVVLWNLSCLSLNNKQSTEKKLLVNNFSFCLIILKILVKIYLQNR